MSQPSSTPSHDPIIPPLLLLGAAGIGLLVAAGSAFINQELGFAGLAGLIVAIFSLIFWALTNPQSLRNLRKGRFLLYGGTAGIVTLVLIVALVLVYVLVRQMGWRADLSQNNNFSLNEQGREVVTLLGQDPTTPAITLTVFYGAAQARTRDLAAVLLDDLQTRSGGRITYQFIDPDREPLTAQRFNAQAGQIAVSRLNADGTPDTDNTQLIASLDQQTLLDALISASAQGNFYAFILQTDSGVALTDDGASGAGIFASDLSDRFKWQVKPLTPLELVSGQTDLNPEADGRVLIIPGGRDPLPDAQAKAITDYLDGGGALVMFTDFNAEGDDLATAANISDYLETNFGFRVNNDLVLDGQNRLPQDPLTLITGNFGTSTLTQGYDALANGLLMQFPHSITISATLPAGVTVTPIVSSMPGSYIKTGLDFATATSADLAATAGDTVGAFVLGVEASNATTGAKVIVYTSPSMIFNAFYQFENSGGRNFDLTRRSVFSAAGYENFAASIASSPAIQSAQAQPIIATDEQLSQINFLSIVIVPGIVLLLGIFVWWTRRERAVV